MKAEPQPRVLARPDHPVSRQDISENTLKVLYRLHNQGYRAYLVGGAVRDLMLGRRPKDFDIGTDARPNDVRRLFRNSRIIGRRFRLVHVFFQEEIVEVSTFRRDPTPEERGGDDDLLITDDNTYGTPREDAFRRDFTVNALFYDIADFSVVDYVGGVPDLEDGVIRAIGEPDVRFQEDPVRMLRACEFAARLGFGIERATQQAIWDQRRQLEKAAPARLVEEVIGLLRCGAAARATQWLIDLALLEVLAPEAFAMVELAERGMGRFDRVPAALDELAAGGRQLSDPATLAALLLPRVLLARFDRESAAHRPMRRDEIDLLVAEEISPFLARLAVSRDRAGRMLAALTGFQRLIEPDLSPRARSILAHRAWFDDALALFEVLVRATGEGGEALADWQAVASRRSEATAQAAAEEERERTGRSRSRRRRRSRTRRRR
ncbi:MAG TPA: polynucleotide adenylyltransferase PcnB [Thermoanaerobaculia bacterium]|nr:polynucleotide adenylyltransferase PcnB [Thermoanaerobaculia bacterium]